MLTVKPRACCSRLRYSRLRHSQRGFSLTEVLLATGVSMLMLVWVGRFQAQSIEDLLAKNSAEYYQSVRNLALQYFKTNKSAMIAAMDTGAAASTWCAINDTTKKICAVDIAKLKANNAAPAWFNNFNPYHQTTYVVYKLVNASSGETEMLIFGAANGTSHRITKTDSAALASQIMGGNGGFIPETDIGACHTTEACGTFGGWKVTLSNFTQGAATPVVGTIASYSYIL